MVQRHCGAFLVSKLVRWSWPVHNTNCGSWVTLFCSGVLCISPWGHLRFLFYKCRVQERPFVWIQDLGFAVTVLDFCFVAVVSDNLISTLTKSLHALKSVFWQHVFIVYVILPASVSYSKWSTLVCPILLSKKKILVHAKKRLLIWICAKISSTGQTNFSWRSSQNKYNSHPLQWKNVGFICSVCECVCVHEHMHAHMHLRYHQLCSG